MTVDILAYQLILKQPSGVNKSWPRWDGPLHFPSQFPFPAAVPDGDRDDTSGGGRVLYHIIVHSLQVPQYIAQEEGREVRVPTH